MALGRIGELRRQTDRAVSRCKKNAENLTLINIFHKSLGTGKFSTTYMTITRWYFYSHDMLVVERSAAPEALVPSVQELTNIAKAQTD